MGVVTLRREQGTPRHRLHLSRGCGMQGVTLVQRAQEPQHRGPIACVLMRLQRQPHRLDVARAGRMQLIDDAERALAIARIDQALDFGHQLGGAQAAVGFGATQPFIASPVLAHAMRGARGDQRREARGLGQFLGLLGFALGVSVAAFEVGLQGRAQRARRALLALALTIERDPLRHLHGLLREPDQRIDDDEGDDLDQQEEIEREIDAIRRIEHHHVAGVGGQRERQADRRSEDQQADEEEAHRRAVLSDAGPSAPAGELHR